MLDLNKKYKRIFAFGCSFTNYAYPTWANLISLTYKDAIFYNFGNSGGGNLFISARVAEANIKFKFNEDDLILLMWSTFYREDRYMHNSWQLPGNIFTQQMYDVNFVKKFADPRGYLIRDLALIELTTLYVKNLPSDNLMLISIPFDHIQNDENMEFSNKDVVDAYDHLIKMYPKSLYELGMNNTWATSLHDEKFKNSFYRNEYHPHTIDYANYLIKLGIDLPNNVIKYAEKCVYLIKTHKTLEECDKYFFKYKKDANKNKMFLW